MDFIRNATTETTHAMAERLTSTFADSILPQGKTWCGRTVRGRTGATIASGIDCERCKASMRKEGWQV